MTIKANLSIQLIKHTIKVSKDLNEAHPTQAINFGSFYPQLCKRISHQIHNLVYLNITHIPNIVNPHLDLVFSII